MPLSEVILIIMGLLTVAMLASGICRNLPIPFTVFLVILGVVLGGLARSIHQFEPLLEFQLTPELVLFLFLPALIFESAFNLDARQLVKDLWPILTLAIPALLISTTIIGAGLWLSLDISFILALLFGALISATDPVAVIALFKELGAPQRLTVLVEGESLLNDATAIVIFNIILGILISGSFIWSDLGIAVGEFFKVFFGGILVGFFIGIIVSELLYRLRLGLSSYLIMSIVLAYAGFALAEHNLHVSGVMAVVSGAITLGIFGVSRISQSATHMVKETWEVIALVCNSLLFLLVGLSVDTGQILGRSDSIVIAIILLLLARASTVYTMVPLTVRMFRLPHITLGERHIMWWGGLKGGLAIAIVFSIPVDIAGRDLLLDLTLGVVMFSLLVNAPTVRPLIKKLGIDRFTDDERSELKHGLIEAEHHSAEILKRFREAELISTSTEKLIGEKCKQVFSSESDEVAEHHDTRHLYITALKIELEELKHLYDIGLIEQYSYLDIKNTLQRDRESWLANPEKQIVEKTNGKPSIFLQIENTLIKDLREHDWAAGFLARYQYMRFSQSIQRDITGFLICKAVLEALEKDKEHNEEQKQQVMSLYQKRLNKRKDRLENIAVDFPEFYQRFENRLFARVALITANNHAQHAHQHSEIGDKVHSRIERLINDAITKLPPISTPAPKLKISDLIGTVPLLNDLSSGLLERLAQLAKPLTFLTNDIIIGQGEKGDALYIITHGKVSVFRQDDEDNPLAELRDGDFFGEMALLGDQVRTATVKAKIPSTLLRLRRRDVLSLAETDPELKRRLEEMIESRKTSNQ